MKTTLKEWKEEIELELKAFEVFWLSHIGEDGFPEKMEGVGEWDEQFYAWKDSR
jgi:hypothetical protein